MSVPRLVRASLLALAVVALSACRLDITTTATMDPDGSGELVLTGTVDAEVVAQVPGLANSLSLDDATSAGWVVEAPATNDDGGLAVTIRHPFVSADELTNLLQSLGPPFVNVSVVRAATDDEIVTTMAGTLSLAAGSFDAFTDTALLQSAGGVPFAAQLAAAGATPSESMSVTFSVDLPGRITETTGDVDDGVITWNAPLDGSALDLATRAVLSRTEGSGWASPVATIALVALIGWLVATVAALVAVVRARKRRAHRARARSPFRPLR